jgi:hypothetical protein
MMYQSSPTSLVVKKANLQEASIEDLVARFEAVTLAQYDADWHFQTTRYNRLYKEMDEIRNELKSRDGDHRRALIQLLGSTNVQVKLKTAISVLAIAPDLARMALRNVRDFGQLPQAVDASMMLEALDNGSFVPD